MAFAGYSTGYKSGGLNSAGGAAALGARRVFNSEFAQDWSTGIKSLFFDRRVLLNVTAFRTELEGFQERSFDGVSFIIRNSGSIRAQGVEIEGRANPTSSIGLDFGLAYLDSTFTDNRFAPGLPACTGAAVSCPLTQDLTGQTPALAPKWQGNLGLQYTSDPFMGGFTATVRADANYSSRIYSTNDLNPQGIVDDFATFGGRLTLISPDQRWRLAVYVHNLTNEQYFRLKFPQVLDMVFGVRVPSTGDTLMRGYVGPPRTVGLKLGMAF
jgi:iron complex outermembrane receptor protein